MEALTITSARTMRFVPHRILRGLAEVIGRSKFARRIHDAELSAKGLVEDYATIAHVVEAPALSQPVSRDPDDDAVLACAIAAQADAVVSGDGDLLTLGSYKNIPIITARQAVERIGTSE
jgi:uncharacterized protein